MPSLPWQGGCQCGKVRYTIRGAPLTLYVCHCRECQRQTGSAFGMSMPVPRAGFEIDGEHALWERTGDSGRSVACAFCPSCGTRLFHAPARNPAIVNVKPGTLDDTSWLEPVAALWTQRAQPWVRSPEAALCYAAQPQAYDAVLAAWAQKWQ